MKGEKSSTNPFPETLSFDYASTSNDTNIDQHICFSNMLNCAHNNDDIDTMYEQYPTQEADNFNGWTMGGPNSIVPQNQVIESVYAQSSNTDDPDDLNMSAEILNPDDDDYLIFERPRIPCSNFIDSHRSPASGSGNLLYSRRYSSKRKSLERNPRKSSKDGREENCSSSSSSSNQPQNVYGLSSRDVSHRSPFALNLNGNSYSSSTGNHHSRTNTSQIVVDFPLTRASRQLLAQNISSQSLAGGLRVASSRRTQNSSRWTEGSISGRGRLWNSRERIEVPGQVPNTLTLPRNIAEHLPVFIPRNDLRNSTQNSVASSSGIQFSGPNWVSHRNQSQYSQRLTGLVQEFIRRSTLASAGLDNGGQSSNSTMPLDTLPSGSSGQGYRASNPSSRLLLDRQRDEDVDLPHSLRGLDSASERSRLVTEQIRNVMDLMHRAENLHFEDVILLDPSMLFGVTNSRDRHRDMRLDIDNMSYEELLALEERIGDVSTGLNDEIILELLKNRKYFSVATSSLMEAEPCSVCREEYKDGEDIGTLDCGHEFHSACIKQWLIHKNLCPICKTTALSK